MQKLKILNAKEIKEINNFLNKQWAFDSKLDYVFLLSQNKNKIYLVSKNFADINLEKLRVDSLGVYFGELKHHTIRVSIEGAQLVGNNCKKNIVNINEGLARLWMRGYDLEITDEILKKDNLEEGFVLIKYNDDFMGCGKLTEKKILNYVPKVRRIRSQD